MPQACAARRLQAERPLGASRAPASQPWLLLLVVLLVVLALLYVILVLSLLLLLLLLSLSLGASRAPASQPCGGLASSGLSSSASKEEG